MVSVQTDTEAASADGEREGGMIDRNGSAGPACSWTGRVGLMCKQVSWLGAVEPLRCGRTIGALHQVVVQHG